MEGKTTIKGKIFGVEIGTGGGYSLIVEVDKSRVISHNEADGEHNHKKDDKHYHAIDGKHFFPFIIGTPAKPYLLPLEKIGENFCFILDINEKQELPHFDLIGKDIDIILEAQYRKTMNKPILTLSMKDKIRIYKT